jgi:hypothetical protein
VNVIFQFSVQGTRGAGPCLRYPAPRPFWADTSLVQGSATVSRRPGIPQFTSDCGGQACHTYSGTQTVSVTPLPVMLQLTASASEVDSGQPVAFTATAVPSSIKGIQVPLKVLGWRWLSSDGGAGVTTACAASVNPCSVIVREAGSMELTALANGSEHVDTASVLVGAGEVKIVPDSTTMKFSIVIPKTPGYIERNDRNTQRITVSVQRSDGTPIRDRVITLKLAATENTAGHLHSGYPPKPGGWLNGADTVEVNTGSTGVAQVTFEAPEVSGPVTITGTSTGATSGSASVSIGVFT